MTTTLTPNTTTTAAPYRAGRARLHTRRCCRCRVKLRGRGMPLYGAGTLCPDCWVTTRVERYAARVRSAVADTLAAENGNGGGAR